MIFCPVISQCNILLRPAHNCVQQNTVSTLTQRLFCSPFTFQRAVVVTCCTCEASLFFLPRCIKKSSLFLFWLAYPIVKQLVKWTVQQTSPKGPGDIFRRRNDELDKTKVGYSVDMCKYKRKFQVLK